jgi:Fe-S oxidoreductase
VATVPAGERDVVLWVDTFNNYFHPEVSQAALQVLKAAGFQVSIPRRDLCCGRPLYDFGFLTRARTYLQRILDDLAAEIDAGLPIVVLEPSCASVFRDELRNLFPGDARAERLRSQTFLLTEFLGSQVAAYEPPPLRGAVLLHRHCHQKAIVRMDHEERLLRTTGVALEAPDAGCCGMAGAFGFAADTFAVAQAVGERRLLPAVRSAPAGTLIVADGFSCREQIRQSTGRHALHVAQVLNGHGGIGDSCTAIGD